MYTKRRQLRQTEASYNNFKNGELVFVPVIRWAFEKVTTEFKITYFYVLNPGVPKG
jgi:hypothetical protein